MVKKSSKGVYITAFILLLSGLAYLVITGLSQGALPTLKVAQALKLDVKQLVNIRLYGTVCMTNIEPYEDGRGVVFLVQDEGVQNQRMRVDFHGAIPDTFKGGAEVILKGSYDPSIQVFRAHQMSTKCPSKYEEKRIVS